MILFGCSTKPSIKVISPVIDVPKLVVKPPIGLLTSCDPLLLYVSNDARDVIKTTIQNHNIYFLCASKMKSATLFLKSL